MHEIDLSYVSENVHFEENAKFLFRKQGYGNVEVGLIDGQLAFIFETPELADDAYEAYEKQYKIFDAWWYDKTQNVCLQKFAWSN